jgi:hypothetical protein
MDLISRILELIPQHMAAYTLIWVDVSFYELWYESD